MIEFTETIITKIIHELHFDSFNLYEIYSRVRVLAQQIGQKADFDDFFKIYCAEPGEGVIIRWEE